uniref:Uncharacterized protein n=1 Tax=Helianthus annuus TaxID=4232 RepID=A0A251TJ98_HELAN
MGIISLMLNKLDGSLGRKRVKRIEHGEKNNRMQGMSYGTPDEDQARKENRTHVSKLPQRSYFVLV